MQDFSQEEMRDLLAMFRQQSMEILEDMSQNLLALELSGAHSGIRVDLIHRIRRGAHTIKGDAACLNLNSLVMVAHRMEDLTDAVIAGNARAGAGLIDAMLAGVDLLRDAVGGDEVADIPERTAQQICARLSDAGERQDEGNAPPEAMADAAVSVAPEKTEAAGTDEAPARAPASGGERRDYVRVQAQILDAMMNMVGEMIVASSMLNQVGQEITAELSGSGLARKNTGANARLNQLIAQLQRKVLDMRMLPVGQLFQRYARPMRDLANELGRQVELTVSGADTEIDRSVADMLYEPLLHLLRNAIDHGIEKPEDRVAAGKPPAGVIRLAAWPEGNQVVLEIADDGRGIDAAALRRKAVESGDLTMGDAFALRDEDANSLLFLPGVSTAREVTLISGRGVGAAAVKHVIDQLRGSVDVRSEQGRGTLFQLRLPLTLAIIRSLLFTSSGRLYALPIMSITEIAQFSTAEVVMVDGVETWRLRDRWISLIRPGVMLGHERRRGGLGKTLRGDKSCFLIILKNGEGNYGIVAETLPGDQELVTKPLDREWLKNEVFAGASVLGDGRVALIFDAEQLVRKAVAFERDRAAGVGDYQFLSALAG
ncbi:MAG: chemotaxis protein CheA [Blastocatellia bacterium]